MLRVIARIISTVFHPFLIPVLGFVLLMQTTAYLAFLPAKIKNMVIVITFLTTCLLPILSLGVMSFSRRFDPRMQTSRARLFPLLMTGIYYFIGYKFLARVPAAGIFQIYLLGAIAVILIILSVSFYWKISIHMSGIGGLLGAMLAFSFRFALNPIWIIAALTITAGLVAFSRIYLHKHTPSQVYAGFTAGLTIMYVSVYFI